MANPRITFNNGAAWTLQSDFPFPANRFRGWLPDTTPIGDPAFALADESLYLFRTSVRYGCHFELPGLLMKATADSMLDVANRLKSHLQGGGSCGVSTEDALSSAYATCGIFPGTVPEIRLTNPRTREYTLRISLINLAVSPVEMVCHYAT